MALYLDPMKALGQHLHDAAQDPATVGNTRLQNLICIGLPIYNMFAVANGWPVFPLPAFCSTRRAAFPRRAG